MGFVKMDGRGKLGGIVVVAEQQEDYSIMNENRAQRLGLVPLFTPVLIAILGDLDVVARIEPWNTFQSGKSRDLMATKCRAGTGTYWAQEQGHHTEHIINTMDMPPQLLSLGFGRLQLFNTVNSLDPNN
jgi:hypothetical protein